MNTMLQVLERNYPHHQARTTPPATRGISIANAIGMWTTLG
ncbi:MAG: hypothetical protein ACI9MR_004155 [Myxococcota bacterium]|jgi:hypothetical protein